MSSGAKPPAFPPLGHTSIVAYQKPQKAQPPAGPAIKAAAAAPPAPAKPAMFRMEAPSISPAALLARVAESRLQAQGLEPVEERFALAQTEFALLRQLRQRAVRLGCAGQQASQATVLRAGMRRLATLGDPDFLAGFGPVPRGKRGRNAASRR